MTAALYTSYIAAGSYPSSTGSRDQSGTGTHRQSPWYFSPLASFEAVCSLRYTNPRDATMRQNAHVSAPDGTRAHLARSRPALRLIVSRPGWRTYLSTAVVSLPAVVAASPSHSGPALHLTVSRTASADTRSAGRARNRPRASGLDARSSSYHSAAAVAPISP